MSKKEIRESGYFTDTSNKLTIVSIALIILVVLYLSNLVSKKEIEKIKYKQYMTFSKNIKHELQILIENKKQTNSFIALSLSKNQNIIESLVRNDHTHIDLKGFAKNIDEFAGYKNVWFQLIDKEGRSFYRSWTKKRGDSMLKARIDVKKMIEKPQVMSTISVGKYDLTFKSMVPIFDGEKFIGMFEIISHFNSIVEKLKKEGVDAVIIAHKKYKDQIKKPFSDHFIDDYYISTLNPKKEVIELLNERGVEYYLSDNRFILHKDLDKIEVTYKMLDIAGKEMGYALMFKSLSEMKSTQEEYIKQDLISIMIVFILISVLIGYYLISQRYEKSLIAQHKKHEEDIVKNTKFFTIGQMAAGITHEINTPLTYIKGTNEMLRYDMEELPEGEIKKELLESNFKMMNGIERIGIIVESMREMAQTTPAIKGECNVYSTIVTVLRMIYNRSKQITRIYVNGELFDLETSNKERYEFLANINNQRIEQVWTIILNNALDELSKVDEYENRYIKINIFVESGRTKVTFLDNAGGISTDIKDKLFDPFISTKDYSGIGIGLNVAKKIIDEHEGEIRGYNKKGGACFEVLL